jgi:hypothetical protein
MKKILAISLLLLISCVAQAQKNVSSLPAQTVTATAPTSNGCPSACALTGTEWSYQSCSEAGTCSNGVPGPSPSGYTYTTWPNYNVDGKPAAARAMEWLTYLHGQTGELYYAADVCNTPSYNPYCVPSGVTWNPWNGIYYSGGWGDGTLVYPGCVGSSNSSAVCYMGSGVTTPLILPSVRLKLIRDGVQDYEYLNVLKNNGKSSLVSAQISSWITNSYTFETSGTGLQSARTALGNAMHALSYSGGGSGGTVLYGVGKGVFR